MKLYHGYPKNLKILKPQIAKGLNEFENRVAIFLTDDFLHAALYAIGKTLKGKTAFGVSKKKLLILGDLKPKFGYVYSVNVKNFIKGNRGQYAYEGELKPVEFIKVFPKDYEKYIFRVKSKEELFDLLELRPEFVKKLQSTKKQKGFCFKNVNELRKHIENFK